MSQGQLIFDTLKYVDHLENHGFNEKQAKGMLEAQTMVCKAQEANMVSQQDLDLRCSQLENKIDKSIYKSTLFLFTGLTGMMAVAVGVLALILNAMLS